MSPAGPAPAAAASVAASAASALAAALAAAAAARGRATHKTLERRQVCQVINSCLFYATIPSSKLTLQMFTKVA